MATVTWHWLTYENGMAHAVPEDLLDAVRHSMASADPPAQPKSEGAIFEIGIDRPGAVRMDRPWTSIEFCGITLEVPCEDLRSLFDAWNRQEPDVSLGRTFYRFIGHPWRCLVLDPGQRQILLGEIASRVDDADRQAEAFYARHETPSQVFRNYNQHLHGVPADHPMYGLDARAKFRPPGDDGD